MDPDSLNMSNVGRPIPIAERGANPIRDIIA
jgi:hypothetical protein